MGTSTTGLRRPHTARRRMVDAAQNPDISYNDCCTSAPELCEPARPVCAASCCRRYRRKAKKHVNIQIPETDVKAADVRELFFHGRCGTFTTSTPKTRKKCGCTTNETQKTHSSISLPRCGVESGNFSGCYEDALESVGRSEADSPSAESCASARAQYYQNKLVATLKIIQNKDETIRVQAESLSVSEARIVALTARTTELKKEIERKNREIQAMRETIKEVDKQDACVWVETRGDCTCGLEPENKRLKQANTLLEKQVNHLSGKVSDLENVLRDKEAENRQIEEHMTKKEAELQALRHRLMTLEAESKECCQSCETSLKQLQQSQVLLKDKSAELCIAQSKCKQYEDALRVVKQEVEKYQGCDREKCALRDETKQQRREVRALRTQLLHAQRHAATLQACCRQEAQNVQLLEGELTVAAGRGAALCTAARRAVTTVRGWAKQLRDVHREQEALLETKDTQLRVLREQIEDLKRRIPCPAPRPSPCPGPCPAARPAAFPASWFASCPAGRPCPARTPSPRPAKSTATSTSPAPCGTTSATPCSATSTALCPATSGAPCPSSPPAPCLSASPPPCPSSRPAPCPRRPPSPDTCNECCSTDSIRASANRRNKISYASEEEATCSRWQQADREGGRVTAPFPCPPPLPPRCSRKRKSCHALCGGGGGCVCVRDVSVQLPVRRDVTCDCNLRPRHDMDCRCQVDTIDIDLDPIMQWSPCEELFSRVEGAGAALSAALSRWRKPQGSAPAPPTPTTPASE